MEVEITTKTNFKITGLPAYVDGESYTPLQDSILSNIADNIAKGYKSGKIEVIFNFKNNFFPLKVTWTRKENKTRL